ncbi:transglutaminase-like domain-containing protein [Nocardia thailandica]
MSRPFVPSALPPSRYLGGDEIVQLDDPAVLDLAGGLRRRAVDDTAFARSAYEWVRDEIAHSYDARDPRVTLTASEVLRERVGLCYAKSHLLAAVLRICGIPTALCYQRLAHGDGHVLHGLIAVYLGGAWHRQDPRGNKDGVAAEFSLAGERLAWRAAPGLGEVDYPQLLASPAESVVRTLRAATDVLAIYDSGLPTDLSVGHSC